MDPLGAIASTITVVGATIKVSEGVLALIGSIRYLPDELLATSNDVTDFRLVLANIQDTIAQEERLVNALRQAHAGGQLSIDGSMPAAAPQATIMVQQAQNKLSEIERVVQKTKAIQNAKGFAALGRIRLLERTKMRLLREDLNNMKVNINAHFTVKIMGSYAASTCAFRSAVLVNRISVEVIQTARETQQHTTKLDDLLQQINRVDGLEQEQQRTSNLVETLINSFGTSHRAVEQAPSTTVNRILYAPSASPSPDLSSPSPADYNDSIFKLDISRFRKRACKPFCSCQCHRRYRRRTPTLMSRVLGSLFLGYSSLPFFAPRCDRDCLQRSLFSATFTYYFPAWFLERMCSLVLMTTPLGDPGAVLKIRKLSCDFSMFRFAAMGDIAGIKSLLRRRVAHPSATFWGGWTPLHYAISNGHAAVCRLLLASEADPLVEDGGNQLSALEWAWTKILGNAFEPQRLVEFQSIFSDRECLEELGFTRLHKIVLGLESGNLQDILDSEGSPDVDETDFEGRTPLSWAAQRGDTPALVVLLHHGADPNLATRKGATPLHHAVEAQTPSCILPLIEHGADVRAVDHSLHTPLHFACKHRDDAAYVAPLIAAGADVNARTDYDYTPLVDAAYKNHLAMAFYLLEHGADINKQGQYCKTPIIYTVEYNSHAVLRLLLARGADCTIQSQDRGPTIAHFAARHGDLETLRLLADARIRGIPIADLESEDFEGLVVEQLITNRMRDGFVEGFSDAFHALIESLIPEDASELDDEAEAGSQEGQEVWEEALEMPVGRP